jgi:hypothetical protein
MTARTIDNMWLFALTPEMNARTCNYWYTVTTYGSTPLTAFRTRTAALRWLALRGLAIEGELPQPGTHGVFRVTGSYRESMHWDYGAFFTLEGVDIKLASNGEYTLGIVTTDPDGLRTVHTLNPNCRRRPVFPWREAQAEEDAGA